VHEDHFSDTEDDDVWTKAIGRKGWILLSKDANIRKRELERQAVLDAGVHAFWLGRADINGKEIAEVFAAAMPKIIKLLDNATGPVRAMIHRDASVVVLADDLSVIHPKPPEKP